MNKKYLPGEYQVEFNRHCIRTFDAKTSHPDVSPNQTMLVLNMPYIMIMNSLNTMSMPSFIKSFIMSRIHINERLLMRLTIDQILKGRYISVLADLKDYVNTWSFAVPDEALEKIEQVPTTVGLWSEKSAEQNARDLTGVHTGKRSMAEMVQAWEYFEMRGRSQWAWTLLKWALGANKTSLETLGEGNKSEEIARRNVGRIYKMHGKT